MNNEEIEETKTEDGAAGRIEKIRQVTDQLAAEMEKVPPEAREVIKVAAAEGIAKMLKMDGGVSPGELNEALSALDEMVVDAEWAEFFKDIFRKVANDEAAETAKEPDINRTTDEPVGIRDRVAGTLVEDDPLVDVAVLARAFANFHDSAADTSAILAGLAQDVLALKQENARLKTQLEAQA